METINKKTYTIDNDGTKKYLCKSKEYVSDYNKCYYEITKDALLKNLSIKVQCDICNKEINKSSYTRHCKSKSHINNLRN